MRRLKFFLSNLLFRRNSSSIICVPYLGTKAYMFENQKDADKLKKGLYAELPELKFFLKQFKQDDVFLDVGSNIGLYAILAAKYVSNVIAFEPIKLNSALINLSLAAHDIQNVTIHENVLSDTDGPKRFIEVAQSSISLCSPDNEQEAVNFIKDVYGEHEFTPLNVNARTLDSFSLPRVDLIKIDVEGMELRVLRGALATIKKCNPRIIMVEIFSRAMNLHNDSAEELFTIFKDLGYYPFFLKNGVLNALKGQRAPNDNVFFVKNKTANLEIQ